jgi:hypothetical protein
MRNLKHKNWLFIKRVIYIYIIMQHSTVCLITTFHLTKMLNTNIHWEAYMSDIGVTTLYKEKVEFLHNEQFSAQQEKRINSLTSFQTRVTILRIMGFWTSSIVRYSRNLENTTSR